MAKLLATIKFSPFKSCLLKLKSIHHTGPGQCENSHQCHCRPLLRFFSSFHWALIFIVMWRFYITVPEISHFFNKFLIKKRGLNSLFKKRAVLCHARDQVLHPPLQCATCRSIQRFLYILFSPPVVVFWTLYISPLA
ncbi:MAG: hypothetical protein JL50_09990 [Peptococcaceae bacterium BICA1-7]|nr:MAG: hypothetical protein JL50_09990 [Peptococcaceae bacterium BICA1-7]HBV95612.1 hypothetical protein [Desulfotomaculum sp.]